MSAFELFWRIVAIFAGVAVGVCVTILVLLVFVNVGQRVFGSKRERDVSPGQIVRPHPKRRTR